MEALRHKGPEQRIVMEFRHDIYRYLFAGKHDKSYVDKNWAMFQENSFSKCGFPANWNCIVDNHGDGVMMKFPVKMRIFVSRTPKTYQKVQGEIKVCPQACIEKMSIKFIKIPTTI